MPGLPIGPAGVLTEEQDLTTQRNALTELSADVDGVYVDHGLRGARSGIFNRCSGSGWRFSARRGSRSGGRLRWPAAHRR